MTRIFTGVALALIKRSENRIGVTFDYIRHIATTDLRLLTRLNRIFGFLDPLHHAPMMAYHAARLHGALAADCGTCVEAEINLARNAGLAESDIDNLLSKETTDKALQAVITLTTAVTKHRQDDPEARDLIRSAYGEKALIEIAYAMNGAALLPGIKRSLGYATTCDLTILRKSSGAKP